MQRSVCKHALPPVHLDLHWNNEDPRPPTPGANRSFQANPTTDAALAMVVGRFRLVGSANLVRQLRHRFTGLLISHGWLSSNRPHDVPCAVVSLLPVLAAS